MAFATVRSGGIKPACGRQAAATRSRWFAGGGGGWRGIRKRARHSGCCPESAISCPYGELAFAAARSAGVKPACGGQAAATRFARFVEAGEGWREEITQDYITL